MVAKGFTAFRALLCCVSIALIPATVTTGLGDGEVESNTNEEHVDETGEEVAGADVVVGAGLGVDEVGVATGVAVVVMGPIFISLRQKEAAVGHTMLPLYPYPANPTVAAVPSAGHAIHPVDPTRNSIRAPPSGHRVCKQRARPLPDMV